MRGNGYNDSRYSWLKDIRASHNGERCFVVATGPSLTMEDLDAIKDEYSFGMNSCILALGKTQWRPSMYMIQDEYVYERLENDILQHSELDIVVNDFIASMFRIPPSFKVFPLHILDHKMYSRKGYGQGSVKFSDDCYSIVYDGYSIIFSILQIACWMGFNEIYLLGCDCNYNSGRTHFISYGEIKASLLKDAGSRLFRVHREFRKFADERGVKVINCTRGGMLEEYPRMSLEEVLGKK